MSPLLRTIRTAQYPFAVIDDPQTRRLFVLEGASVNASSSSTSALAASGIGVIDAASGATIRTQAFVGNIGLAAQPEDAPAAVDPRNGDLWLLVGPRRAANGVARDAGRLVLLDGRTGRPLRAIALGLRPDGVGADGYGGVGIDGHVGRVYLADGTHALILGEATGAARGVVPGGGARFRVVVDAPRGRVYLVSLNGEVMLDERTGAVLATTTPPTRGRENADALVVDARAGTALVDLSDQEAQANRVCALALASGRVVRCADGVGGAVMAADATTHRAFAARVPNGSVIGPFMLDTLDTRGGRPVRTETFNGSFAENTMVSMAVDERAGRVYMARDTPDPSAALGQLLVLDARTGRVVRTESTGSGTWEAGPAVAVDPGTERIFVANTFDRTIDMFDAPRL